MSSSVSSGLKYVAKRQGILKLTERLSLVHFIYICEVWK